MSDLVELAAFAAIVVGVDRLAGSGWAWVVAGLLGVILSVGMSEVKVPRLRWRRRKQVELRGTIPGAPGVGPHPPLQVNPEAEEFARHAARSRDAREAMWTDDAA